MVRARIAGELTFQIRCERRVFLDNRLHIGRDFLSCPDQLESLDGVKLDTAHADAMRRMSRDRCIVRSLVVRLRFLVFDESLPKRMMVGAHDPGLS